MNGPGVAGGHGGGRGGASARARARPIDAPPPHHLPRGSWQ